MVLFPVTLNDPNYMKPPFATFCIAFHIFIVEIETSNLVGRLKVASASPRNTIPERGVVISREPLNFGGHQPYLWNGWSSQVLST